MTQGVIQALVFSVFATCVSCYTSVILSLCFNGQLVAHCSNAWLLLHEHLLVYKIQNSLSRNFCYVSNKCNFPSFRVVFLCGLNVHDTNESTVR